MPFPLGRTGLARALKGLPSSPVQADRFRLFGALSALTRKCIGQQIAEMVEQGLLTCFEQRGYQVLRLADKGRALLKAHQLGPASPPAAEASPKGKKAPAATGDPVDYDKALFEQLRTWRREKAQELATPPYVISHDVVLKRIAATSPTTLAELAAIKGIGPHKLEQYGPDILEIVASSATEPAKAV